MGEGISFHPYEVARLAIAIVVLPFALALSWKLRERPGRIAAGTAIIAIYLSYLFTIVEGFYAGQVMNVLQHACYAIAGVSAAVASWMQRAYLLREEPRR